MLGVAPDGNEGRVWEARATGDEVMGNVAVLIAEEFVCGFWV